MHMYMYTYMCMYMYMSQFTSFSTHQQIMT